MKPLTRSLLAVSDGRCTDLEGGMRSTLGLGYHEHLEKRCCFPKTLLKGRPIPEVLPAFSIDL